MFALKTIPKNNDLIIQKSDKSNSIVLINKSDYLDQMYNILSDSNKFEKSSLVNDKHRNFIIGIEKKLADLLKELKAFQKLTTKNLNQEVPVLLLNMACAKFIKRFLTNTHDFELFCQQSKHPLIIQQNFQFPSLNPLKNYFTVKNSFEFSKKICEQNPEYFMASHDVESLFTNILLEETIKICCDSLYKNQGLLSNISKNQFEKLSRAALCNNYFLFDGIVYQQVD